MVSGVPLFCTVLLFALQVAPVLPLVIQNMPNYEDGPGGLSTPNELDYELHLTAGYIAPDGRERIAALVSGQTPGPLIRAQKGDILNVNVINDLNHEDLHHSASIHWHGIHMLNNNFNDGTSTVTQCPITPNNAYQYTVPTNRQAGTFWYHSHFSSQYCDGVRGPLIVYDPDDPHLDLYDIDDESTIISIADWYTAPAKMAFRPGPDVVSPFPNSTLINGVGIMHKSEGQSGSLAIIDVKPNKRYRMRLINMACDPAYRFSIDGHMLKIIEADSIPVKPIDVDGLDIFAGQRYSFVLNTNQEPGNYWVRSLPNRAVEESYNNNINVAILRYRGAPNTLPPKPADVDIPVIKNLLLESSLEPFKDMPVPGIHELGKADVILNLETKPMPHLGFISLGDKVFTPPPIPVLLQILSGTSEAKKLLPTGSLYSLPPNKVVEITLPGESETGPHPFHLHGHDFWVVKSVDGSEPKWSNAIMRDTVNAGMDNQSVTIRFVTDNPGPWFLHCHVDWHLDVGLGIVFVEDAKTVITNPRQRPTQQWNDLCPTYYKYKQDGGRD